MLLLIYLLSAEPWWWSSDSFVSGTSVPDDPQVNSGGDRVVLFVVDFRQRVVFVNGGFAQIPQSSGIDHVSDDVFSDGFVLWNSASRGFTSYEFDVSSAFLVSSGVSSFFSHV